MLRIALKDLKLFLADRRALALTFLLPVVLITVFYFAFGGSSDTDSGNAPVISMLLVDLDSTQGSRTLISQLDSMQGLRVEKLLDEERATKAIAEGKRAALLLLHPGFGDSLLAGSALPAELVFDRGRPMEFGILSQILFSELGQFAGPYQGKAQAKRQMVENFGLTDDAAESLLAQMGESESAEGPPPLQLREVVGERKNDFGLIQAVAGTAVMLLLFSVAGMGSGLLAEKEEGTLKKLLYAPIRPGHILLAKLISTIGIAVVQLMIMFVFAALAFGLDLLKNLPGLFLMILTTATVCAAFGILLASVCTSRKQLDGLATIIILVMSAVGGSMMPVVFMPKFLQSLAVGTVNYWSIQGFYDIYWRELGFSAILDNAAVLAGISAILISLSFFFFKRNVLRLV